jgi:peptidyl-prolyl cis-trans isomerase D
LSQFLKTRKKAELIKAKMTGSSMEAIAKSAGSTVLQATDVIWKIHVNRCGLEPKVVGNAFALGANKTPIRNTGYMLLKT